MWLAQLAACGGETPRHAARTPATRRKPRSRHSGKPRQLPSSTVAGGRRIRDLRELAEDGSEHVRATGELAGTETVADFLDLHGGHEVKFFRELRGDGGASGRDELVRDVDLPEGDALQNFEGGRSGHGESTVGAVDSAVAVVQAAADDFLHAEGLEANAGEDDVRDGIEGTDFVKVNILGAHAVDFALGLGDSAEDGEGALLYEG